MEYKVTWTLYVDADSVEDAIDQTQEAHRDPDSWANHIVIEDAEGNVIETTLPNRDRQ